MRRVLLILALVCSLGAAQRAAAGEEIDLELVLLADASGSIDQAEILFQRRGYAQAITDPAVLSAIAGGAYQRIAVTYVEWADARSQDVVVPWMVIDGEASARRFAEALLVPPRRAFGPNAIGSAIDAAHRLIDGNGYDGLRRVIDFSGDSANTFGGIPIAVARARALAAGIVINGLAILCRDCNGRPVSYDLEKAFAELIVGGPGSFVVTADSRARFAAAVRDKLVQEIAASEPAAPAPVRPAHACAAPESGVACGFQVVEIGSDFRGNGFARDAAPNRGDEP